MKKFKNLRFCCKRAALTLFATLILPDSGLLAAVPTPVITHNEAQSFFGGRHAKALVHYPSDDMKALASGPVYMIDFSKGSLGFELLCDAANNKYAYGDMGDADISRDGSRWAFISQGKIHVAEMKAGAPGKTEVAEGFSPRWWVHPLSREEYLIYVDTKEGADSDVSGTTYMQKMKKGTCEPEGPRLVLNSQYAFRGGRSPSGRYMFTTAPGYHEADLGADSLKVENASFSVTPGNTGRQCNGSVSPDPDHPHRHIHATHDHASVGVWEDGVPKVQNPDVGYSFYFFQEWSNHPDFFIVGIGTQDDHKNLTKYHGYVYSWSQDAWLKFARNTGALALWVSNAVDTTPPTVDPAGLSGSIEPGPDVVLSWTAAQDPDGMGILGYTIYRKQGSGDFMPIGNSDSLTYRDTPLNESTTYSYYVVGVNSGGLQSGPSNTMTVTTPSDTRPPSVDTVIVLSGAKLLVVYDESVGESAINPANYGLDGGASVTGAVFQAGTESSVILDVTSLTVGNEYVLSVSNVKDKAQNPNTCTPGTSFSFTVVIAEDVVIDDEDATAEGAWSQSSVTSGYYGDGYHHDQNAGKGSKTFTFAFNAPFDAAYEVALRWTAGSNRATNVPVIIVHAAGSDTQYVNMQENGGQWNLIGTYSFRNSLEGSVTLSNSGTDGYVIADAVKLHAVESSLPSPVFNPGSGATFASEQPVYLSCSDQDALIYYTLDGTEPTTSSSQYVDKITLTQSATIKARAFRDGYNPSPVVSAAYTKNALGRLITPQGGETYAIGDTLTITWESFDTTRFYATVIEMRSDALIEVVHLTAFGTIDYGTADWGTLKWVIPPEYQDVQMNNKSWRVEISQYNGDFVDKNAQEVCIGDCQSPVNGSRVVASPMAPFTVSCLSGMHTNFHVNADEPHSIALYDLRGALVWQVRGYGKATYALPNYPSSKAYVVKSVVGGNQYSRALIIRR